MNIFPIVRECDTADPIPGFIRATLTEDQPRANVRVGKVGDRDYAIYTSNEFGFITVDLVAVVSADDYHDNLAPAFTKLVWDCWKENLREVAEWATEQVQALDELDAEGGNEGIPA